MASCRDKPSGQHGKIPLDDLLALTREYLCPEVSRSGLDHCLRRHGVGKRRYLFVAIERTTRMVFHKVMPAKTAQNARRFLDCLVKASPLKTEDSDRKRAAGEVSAQRQWQGVHRPPAQEREKEPAGEHEFDQLCTAWG